MLKKHLFFKLEKGGLYVITFDINEQELREMFTQKLDEHIQQIKSDTFFMTSKQLCSYLNLSWNTVAEYFCKARHRKKINKNNFK
jgi:hypothetical protein